MASSGIARRRCLALLVLPLAVLACGRDRPAARSGPPQRIITMTPTVTEIVVALGAGERLVGLDRYSRESAESAADSELSKLPVVGDFVAPNVEAIAKLAPDLVVLDAAQAKAATSLDAAGYRTLLVSMHTMADVRAAVTSIASAVDAGQAGTALTAEIDAAIESARRRSERLPARPRVLWVIDRQPGELANLIGAGPGSYADELVRLTGGRNALAETGLRYPKISREALARLEIDLVIDSSGAAEDSMAAWRTVVGPMIAPLPTSAATPRPDLKDSLGRVGNIIGNAAATMADEAAP